MPILQTPGNSRTVTLPPRRAVPGGQGQVLVVGGGPAGLGAAVGAAAAGADVVLVERYGFLGGNATVALVMPLMSFHNETKQAASGAPFEIGRPGDALVQPDDPDVPDGRLLSAAFPRLRA